MERREMDRAEEKYMERAIVLAEQGRGWTNPNPVVGAVIVKGEKIIGEGYHGQYGGLHAEREAIAALTEPADASLHRRDSGTKDWKSRNWFQGP